MRTLILALIISLVVVTPVFAQDPVRPLVKEKIQEKRVEVKERIEEKKELLMAKREEKKASISARKAELKDKKKEAVLGKVSDNLNKINQNATAQMTKFLGKTEEVLTKLETRVTQKGTEGKDTTQAVAAIAAAKTSIQVAEDAVAAQSVKDYTVSSATDETARTEAQTKKEALRADLKATKDLVESAKKAVSEAIRVSATTLNNKNTQATGGTQ